MANKQIKDLPENTPQSGDWLVSDVLTAPTVYTTSKAHLSAVRESILQPYRSSFVTLSSLSGGWQQAATATAISAVPIWNSTYYTVLNTSGNWSAAYNSFASYSTNWNNAAIGFIHPHTTASPVNNGDLTFEATSNTQLTLRFKGSDGVIRSAVINLT